MRAVDSEFDVASLPERLAFDPEREALAKARQAAVWRGETPDHWPLICSAGLTQRQQTIPGANYQEAYYDNRLMLCSQVRSACGVVNAGADGVPSIRANLGTGICLATVGLAQQVFPDKMPWLQKHLTLEDALALTPDDISIQGDFARGLEQMRFFKEVMGDSVATYCMDTQGPFDLAHLLIGDEIFYAIYDEPEALHQIMEFCLEMGIRTHTWMKEINGEALDQCTHGNALYSENLGIRICEDTTVLISRETMEEFAIPYTRRLAAHFGKAFVHYCGRNDDLTDLVCQAPELQGINFGMIPGRIHDHDYEKDMTRIAESNTIYFGSWPRYGGESGRAYLARLHRYASQGALIPQRGQAAMGGTNGFETLEEVLDFWYSL